MTVSGCSAYKKVASLAANQQAIPQSSAPAAAPHQATPEEQHSRAAADTGGREGTEGILAHSQEPRQHEGTSKALPTSLFRGAMRRLAGEESQGAQHVQVSCTQGLAAGVPQCLFWPSWAGLPLPEACAAQRSCSAS